MIKIGKKYRIKKGHEGKCANFAMEFEKDNGCYIVITEDKSGLYYRIYNSDNDDVGNCWDCFKEEHLIPFEKTMQDIEYGDVIIHNGSKRKVLGRLNNLMFVSSANRFNESALTNYTIDELIKDGYRVYEKSEEMKNTDEEIRNVIENLKSIKSMGGKECAIKLVDDMIETGMHTYKHVIPIYNHDTEQEMPDGCVAIVTIELIPEKLFNDKFGIGK